MDSQRICSSVYQQSQLRHKRCKGLILRQTASCATLDTPTAKRSGPRRHLVNHDVQELWHCGMKNSYVRMLNPIHPSHPHLFRKEHIRRQLPLEPMREAWHDFIPATQYGRQCDDILPYPDDATIFHCPELTYSLADKLDSQR